jgi:hypothetical protein
LSNFLEGVFAWGGVDLREFGGDEYLEAHLEVAEVHVEGAAFGFINIHGCERVVRVIWIWLILSVIDLILLVK